MSAVARRYALAAIEAAEQAQDSIDALAASLNAFGAAYADSRELRGALANPALEEARVAILDSLLGTLKAPKTTGSLLRVLLANHRMDEVQAVAEQVQHLADERSGRLRAEVWSAIEVSSAHKQRIAKALEKRFGRPVEVGVHVDPSVIGGLVCQIGDLTLDSSLRRQLELMREQFDKSI